jgi:hypothetical protein
MSLFAILGVIVVVWFAAGYLGPIGYRVPLAATVFAAAIAAGAHAQTSSMSGQAEAQTPTVWGPEINIGTNLVWIWVASGSQIKLCHISDLNDSGSIENNTSIDCKGVMRVTPPVVWDQAYYWGGTDKIGWSWGADEVGIFLCRLFSPDDPDMLMKARGPECVRMP